MLINKISFATTLPVKTPVFKGRKENKPQEDTFESSKKTEKKVVVNPIKFAQMRAAEIIRKAQQDAAVILNNAATRAETFEAQTIDEVKEKAKQQAQDELISARKKYEDEMNTMARESKSYEEKIKQKKESLEYWENYFSDRVQVLCDEQDDLKSQITSLQEILSATNQDVIQKQITDEKKALEEKINAYTLDYDYYLPNSEIKISLANIQKGASEGIPFKFTSFLDFDKVEETPFVIPEFNPEKSWSFTVPSNGNIETVNYQSLEFSELKNQETNISMNYADSVNWNCDKISRDILQNFFDGNNQTLDGVEIKFDKQENGRFKVRISSKAKYSQEKAILLGESSKRNNARAAGNYGEGLKIVVLKLLKEYGADCVNIASDNWKVEFSPKKSSICNKEVLSYSLLKNEPVDGNYIEFETDDLSLLNSLTTSIDNFYHSNNNDFKNLVFENDLLAIKKLQDDEYGSVYIAGQKFEFNKQWNGLKGYNIIFKEKPNSTKGVLDISRDRISLNNANLADFISDCVLSEKISKEDAMKLLNVFREAWDKEGQASTQQNVLNNILKGIIRGISFKGFQFNFPDVYLAAYSDGFDQREYFYKDRHTICIPEFCKIGMKSIVEKELEDKPQHLVEPNDIQIKKIALIKEAVQCLKKGIERATMLDSNYKFTQEDFNPSVYIFNKSSAFAGEHRKDGFWISEDELKSDFNRIISTVLHEMSHKFGGDGTMAFTYALTNMLSGMINSTVCDENALIKLRAIKSCWDDLCAEELKLKLDKKHLNSKDFEINKNCKISDKLNLEIEEKPVFNIEDCELI